MHSVWVAAPCSGVECPSPNAIEWVADHQVECRFPSLLRLSGSGTHSHALPLLGRRPCNSLPWLVGGPSFPALFGGSRTCKCSEGEARVEDPRRCLHALDSGPNVEYIYSAQVLARR